MRLLRRSNGNRQVTGGRSRTLRRIDIGPRLLILVAIPVVALIGVIGLLVADDIERFQSFRSYSDETTEVADLIVVLSSLQEERHQLVAPDSPAAITTPVSADLMSPLANALRFGGSNVDAVQFLPEARRLADQGDTEAALVIYTDIIDDLALIIDGRLANAPQGQPSRASDSLRALLQGQENFLQEDIAVRSGETDDVRLGQYRTSALIALERFSVNASLEASEELSQLRSGSAWTFLDETRLDVFELNDSASLLERWHASADVRRTSLVELTLAETERFSQAMEALEEGELAELLSLLGVIAAILALSIFCTLLIRRSIVGPLSRLTVHARSLSRGEVAAVNDPANDEIAEVGSAFSSLAATMQHLFTNIDDIAEHMHLGNHERRIDTEPLTGDWLRLATTMNSTLDTSAAHHDATKEDLDRRTALTEITNAAILADNAQDVTRAVIAHLPEAQAGSHAAIFEHPSGPPLVELGHYIGPPLSALEVPTAGAQAQRVTVDKKSGVGALIEFSVGPPAVLVLFFGSTEPGQIEPFVSLVETAARVLSQAHRRHAAEVDATHNREHDPVTGLANVELLQRWFAATSTENSTWSVVGIAPQQLDDLDGSFGRDARNLALRKIGAELEQLLVTEMTDSDLDIPLVRTDEPEFVAIVPAQHGKPLANRFAQRFAEPIHIAGTSLSIDVTIGLADVADGDIDLTDALTNVTTAVRRGQGRTTEIVPFEERFREDVRRRAQLVRWLEHAIENRDLTVHFQPVVNAYTTTIEGYECLIRGSLDGEPVSPAEFIPLAEETKMIVAIGEFVLREGCAALPFLRGDNPYVAINLSPLELSDPYLLDRIDNVLTQSAVDRSRIVFEITEGTKTSSSDAELVKRLRRLGVRIAIDDFGSGHANLAYLNSLPAQIVKLDRSLVTPIVDDEGAASIVRKAIEMAHGLGMSVVAEGVETEDELNALRRMRCDRIQGWLTGRPNDLDAFIEITIERPLTQISRPRDRS